MEKHIKAGNLPTAEEFLIDKGIANPIGEIWRLDLSRDCYAQTEKDIHTAMIEFAKLHCEAQAEAIADKAYITYSKHTGDEIICKDSILNSYPLEKIK